MAVFQYFLHLRVTSHELIAEMTGPSALSKTDPPMLSKSDPGNLNLTPPTGSARDDDDESSRCQRLGRNHAESAAGGSGRIRE
jgi:hypothetical protein